MSSSAPLFLLPPTPELSCADPNFKNLCHVMLTCLNCSRRLMTVLPPSINSRAYIIPATWLPCPLCKSHGLSSKPSSSSLLSLSWLVSSRGNGCSLQYRRDMAMEICLHALMCNLTPIHRILASCMICRMRSDVHLTGSASSSWLFLYRFGPVHRRCSIFFPFPHKNGLLLGFPSTWNCNFSWNGRINHK